jgi:hypothetical protein
MNRTETYRISGPYLYLILLSLAVVTLIPSLKPAWAQQVFETQRAVILYDNPGDLLVLERRLRFSQVDKFQQSYFYTQDPVQAALAPKLAAKIDGLLVKVCLILNRWPKKQDRLRIFLISDGKQVKQRYLALRPFAQNLLAYGPLEAFYEPRTRTIFLSVADIHAGILAHELAHFVLCESSAVPPPVELQEDWARYVETRIN